MPDIHTTNNTTVTGKTFNVGDEVTIADEYDPTIAARYPGVWTVEKVPVGARGVNYVLRPKNGGRGLKTRSDIMHPHDPSKPAPTAPAKVVVPHVPTPSPGTVVTVHGVRSISPDTLMVVIGEARNGDAKIADLGCSDFHYWNIPARMLQTVNLDMGKVAGCIIPE